MIIFSVVLYVLMAIALLMGKPKTQRFSMVLSTCFSSFFSFYFLGINYFATAIYFVMGIVSVFFFWVSLDSKEEKKDAKKGMVVLLAVFLGSLGIHRVYLKHKTLALFYVLLFWSGISTVLSIIDIVLFLLMSKENFDKKYNTVKINNNEIIDITESDKSHTIPSYSQDPEFYSSGNLENKRDGDKLNYNDIRLCGYQAKAIGDIEDFVITVYKEGQTYIFKSKDGDICSVRSSNMRNTKNYEVAQ